MASSSVVIEHELDTDEEYIEEEILVYADLEAKIASDTLRDSGNVKIIGFETGEPIMEIGDKIFQGTFEHAVGTHLFFSTNSIPPPCLENYETTPATWFKFLTKTDRILRMNRIFVDAKDDCNAADPICSRVDGVSASSSCTDASKHSNAKALGPDPIIITKSYTMALNQLLKPGENPPRSVGEEDEEFYRKYKSELP